MSIDNEERKKRCAEAMRAHGDAVYRLAFARCRNTADAEDIFQTTFLRFYASPIPFGNPEHEKAWLLRVCINACKDLQRAHGARRYLQCPMSSMLPTRVREKRQRRKKRRSMKPCKGCRLNSAQWFICIILRAFRPGRQRKCSACVRRRCAAICIEHVSP